MADLQAVLTQLKGDSDFLNAPQVQQFDYLDKHVLPTVDPDYAKGTPQQRQSYVNDYIFPAIKPKTDFIGDLTGHALNAAAGFTQDSLIRNSGNGVGATLGDFIGGLVPIGAGSLAGGAAGTVIPGLGNIAGGVGGGILAAGGAGAAQNLQQQRIMTGRPDLGQVAGAGVVGAATQAIPILKSEKLISGLLKNAALHGAAGAAGNYAQQAVEQRSFTPTLDLNQLRQSATLGAAGGSVGATLHGRVQKQITGPRIVNREAAPTVGIRRNGRILTEQAQRAEALRSAVQRKLNEAAYRQSTSEAQTQKARIQALRKQYENLSQISNNPQAEAKVRQTAESARRHILEAHNKLAKDYEAKFSKPKKAAKEPLEHITDAEDLKALTGLVRQMRAEGNTKQADVAMGRFTRETKARVYDEVKRQEKLQKDKQSQAQKDNKTLNTAEAKVQERTNRVLKGDIQSRSKPPAKPKATPINREQNRKTLISAIEKQQALEFEHRAEKAGTRDESTFRKKLDLPYEMGKNTKGEYVRSVNENGQVTMRYLDDIHSDIKVSDEPHPYRYDREGVYRAGAKKGQSGRFRVLDEDGNEVKQISTNLTKDSKISAELDKMRAIIQAVDSGQKPKVSDVLDAARGLKAKPIEENPMPEGARKELYKHETGEYC